MKSNKNYLLGKGELLTDNVNKSSGGGGKNPPYDLTTAINRMQSRIANTVERFEALPNEACPNDKVVAALTMHPRYISKSDFPSDLMRTVGFKAVGGKASYVTPEHWGVSKHPEGAISDTWYVATTREELRNWSNTIQDWNEEEQASYQLQSIEEFYAPKAESKIKGQLSDNHTQVYEALLHSDSSSEIIDAFYTYSKSLGIKPIRDKVRFSGGVIFVPLIANRENITQITHFSYLRAIRRMPTLRTFRPPVLRSDHVAIPELPTNSVKDENIRVAIFDGGLPENSPLLPWVTYIQPKGIGEPLEDALDHGEAVTSAYLFGHLAPSKNIQEPFTYVDHVRVIGETVPNDDDLEMYSVLDHIINHLDEAENPYQYVNLSLGPDLPVEDDEITAWTAELDQRASSGRMLITVAAGNSGENDRTAGLNRIQPPSDGVNILAVGACNSQEEPWHRCTYSSIGPGRTPGVAKPDGVIFGGDFERPFGVVSTLHGNTLNGTMGTSFAAPFAMRAATGIQCLTGNELSVMATRALMIHHADTKNHSQNEVGWGKFFTNPEQHILCADDEVTVIYQGHLPLKEYLRASIPMPPSGISGMVDIKTTLVIAPEVDPAFAHAYTRAGLEVVFRPSYLKFKDDIPTKHPKSESFFSIKNLYKSSEFQLRSDGHKWEPCLKATRRKRGSSLDNPCFDIYYHNRDEGQPDIDARPLPYVLIVSMKAAKVKNLYQQIINAYSEILQPIEPNIQIPIEI